MKAEKRKRDNGDDLERYLDGFTDSSVDVDRI